MLTRRCLLHHTAAFATLAVSPVLRGMAMPPAIALRRASDPATSIPADFMGLGYEMSSVAQPGLLSTSNERHVRLVQQLGSQGVLRAGGIVADFTRYEPNGVASSDMQNTVITRSALEQFGAFLKKLNWTAIWSVNFAQGTMADAAAEAAAVSEVLGSSLKALELGNEVENYAHGRTFRKAPYTYQQYRAEYKEWRAAILKAVPKVSFAAPDTADNVEWVESMAKDANGAVQLLTTHYYRNGQKQGSAEQLTHADPKLLGKLVRLRAASEGSGIPWRLCEANSFSGGGLPGVSNTLLGALWTLDFLCLLARYSCAGVNLETGVNQLGFISFYSPIQDDGHANNTAGVPYYGMLAFATAQRGCGQAIVLEVPAEATDLTAYAFGSGDGVQSLVLVNRGRDSVQVSAAALGLRHGTVLRLNGPASDSKTGITFGGAAVDASGNWAATQTEHVDRDTVRLPGMSAAVVRVR